MQVLEYFLIECIISKEEPEEGNSTLEDPKQQWMLYVDGASNTYGSRARFILISLKGWDVQYTLNFRFSFTKNKAKYKALIAGLTIAKEMGVRHLKAHSDS